jgi:hypothetical protein
MVLDMADKADVVGQACRIDDRLESLLLATISEYEETKIRFFPNYLRIGSN